MKQILLFLLFLCLPACSIPGIYVLKDSLTAAQHNDLGVSYEKENKLELAEKEYLRAIQKDKRWHIPYFNLGNVYYRLSDNDKAVRYYRSGLKVDPDNADIMNNLAFVLMEQGNLQEAKKWIEKAIAIADDPEYLDTQNKIHEKMMVAP
jgi:Tfp pilus assembly protein PilF